MRGTLIVNIIIFALFVNLASAEMLKFDTLEEYEPYYNFANNYLINCEKNPTNVQCNEEQIQNMKLTVTSYFYTRAAYFYNRGIYNDAQKEIKHCINKSELYGLDYYYDLCNNISQDIEKIKKEDFGEFSDRMIWVLDDDTLEETPWNIRLDLTEDFNGYTTILENLVIKPINSDSLEIGLFFIDNRNESADVFQNDEISHAYLFINSLEQSYNGKTLIDFKKNRLSICFDSSPFLCTYFGKVQSKSPRLVKYYSGYVYGLDKIHEPINLDFFNGIKLLNKISDYPFLNYESEVLIFFPSKKQILKNIEICGSDQLNIKKSKVQLINPSLFDRASGAFSIHEIVEHKNVNKTVNLLEYNNNCFFYHFPSNSEGRQVSGYWLYSIKSNYGYDRSRFYSYFFTIIISILILVSLPIIVHILFNKHKFFNYKKTLILIPLTIFLAISGWQISSWKVLIIDSPTILSWGNILVLISIIVLIILTIFMIFILLKLNKHIMKKSNDMHCLNCGHHWKKRKPVNNKSKCPSCQSVNIDGIKKNSEGSE